ncbi:MAG: DEAD/DEAH box helicase family protein [Solirubrobacterales bacterium]
MAKEAVAEAQVGQVTDQNPIINDPFAEPSRHWHFGDGAPEVRDGRRVAGYVPPMVKGGQLQITDEIVVMEQVNRIRDRVREWREGGYPGATPVTRALFAHWFDEKRELRPFFAQQEAIETVAWLAEAPAEKRTGITIEGFEAYERWAVKLATGAGKTLVMGMTIAWSGLNKVVNRQDRRFTDAFLVVAPNLTVKGRLTGDDGLLPSDPNSVFPRFDLVPGQYAGLLGQLKVQVTNWHQLAPKEDPKRSVLRRGPESDSAFARRVLTDLGPKKRIMVLNDEAHHAWRPPAGLKVKGAEKDEVLEATVWIDGLARIHEDREILRCLDFSATPMYPGAVGGEKAWRPFEWVVSDFGLVDAIESGLVKIPRIPTDDDSGLSVPKYRNLWEYVKKALPKRGDDPDDAGHPLIDYLSEVDGPLKQLSDAWASTLEAWVQAGRSIPPVMIVVCNETKMAEMLEIHIARRGEASPWLQNRDGEQYTVRIDSKLLADAEARDEGESAQDAAERLRGLVATVGKEGQPGEQVRCLVSVGMLSEGWDARNVTQILGLRAFQSQLLCEQVVGRGLRRADYSDLSKPEYVDVYGVPFQLLPFARAAGAAPIEPPQTTTVRSLREREHLRLEFPRVEQIINDVGDVITVDFDAIEPIVVSSENDPNSTWVEFEVGTPGKGIGGKSQDRAAAYERFRMQRLVFRLAADLVTDLDGRDKPWVFPQLVKIVEQVVATKVEYASGVRDRRELCNLRYVAELRNRIRSAIRSDERDGLLPVLNEYDPIGVTEVNFQTAKPAEPTEKSHISHVVWDSKLERDIARQLERDDRVVSYAKNERIFFEVPYRWQGTTARYRPDFLVKLTNGMTLVIEGKGRKMETDDAKLTAVRRWIDAVNSWGRLGSWGFGIVFKEAEVTTLIDEHA